MTTIRLTRRTMLKGSAAFAAASSWGMGRMDMARAYEPSRLRAKAFAQVDELLGNAIAAGQLPGVVALLATENGVAYEGVFGSRRLDGGSAMTRDTVFRVASMVKPITTVAALQLVEEGKLSLEAPVPDIEPELGSPQVLDGFGTAGAPQLRPAKTPISLHQLLTHTSGFTYRLWDAKAVHYASAVEHLPPKLRSKAPRSPLMFDPGRRWQYGTGIDWVGRIVEAVSGEPLDAYFRKHIFDPLGMKDTAFVISPQQRAREANVHRREPDGSLKPEPAERPPAARPGVRHTFSGGGGIYSTAPDYLTFVRMLLQGGTLDGARVLRPDTVALMGENQIGPIEAGILKTTSPALSEDVDFFHGVSLKWGFGHMINMQPVRDGRSAGSLTWGGLFNTYYWVDPAKRLAAVFMTQVLPFADTRALHVYRQFERGVYTAVG